MIYQAISLVGAFLILLAFVLNQTGRLSLLSYWYQWLNLLGGIALFVTALHAVQYGFIVLEGTWSVMSVYGIAKVWRMRSGVV